MTDQSAQTDEDTTQAVATTGLTETGAAMFQLIAYGMISPADANHLVRKGLAEPDWVNIELGTPKPEMFELIALTPDGTAIAEQLERRMTPIHGLCEAQQVTNTTGLSNKQWVMTRETLWDYLSNLKASIAMSWRSDVPTGSTLQSDISQPDTPIIKRNKVKKRLKLNLLPRLDIGLDPTSDTT